MGIAGSKSVHYFTHHADAKATEIEQVAMGTCVHLRDVVQHAHWDSGWPDSYLLYATYRDPATGKWVENLMRTSDTGIVTPLRVTECPTTIEAWNQYWTNTILPARAGYMASQQLHKMRERIDAAISSIEFPSEVRRGQTWVVVRGRKFPHGTVGKVFWVGTNKWGTSAGLATSDRVDPSTGRNLDAIFVSTGNLRLVLDDQQEAEVVRLREQLAATVEGSPVYDQLVQENTRELLDQWRSGTMTCPLWNLPLKA